MRARPRQAVPYPTLPTKECATAEAWLSQRIQSSYRMAFFQAVLDHLFQGNDDLKQHASMGVLG